MIFKYLYDIIETMIIKFLKKNKYKILLIFILLLAVFLRAYNINSTPPGIYSDEALNANNAIEVLNSGDFKVFYTDNNGREGLFINLIALSFYFFGIGIWQLKLPSIVIGVLTVLGTYFLTKEIFRESKFKQHSEKIALLSSFFITTSFWHIAFSRIAFRGILTPLILTFAILFLFIALRKNKWYFFTLSGIIFGLGGYVYPALQISPILIIFIFSYFYFRNKKDLKNKNLKIYFKNISIFLLTFFLTLAPIFYYFSNNQTDTLKRQKQLSVFSLKDPSYEISKNTILTLGQFNIKGDCNPRHNYNCQSQIFWLVGIFFLAGILFFFKYKKQLPFAVLLFWFFLLLLPAILTNEGLPHSLRSIGSLVPAYIFSGFGAFLLFTTLTKQEDFWEKTEKYKKQLHRIRKEIFVFAFLLLIFSGYSQAYKYFDSFAFDPKTINQFEQKYSNIAEKINEVPKDVKKYIIVNTNGVWVDNVPIQSEIIKFLTKDDNIIYLREDEIRDFKFEQNSAIIPLNQTVDIFKKVQKNSPEGKITLVENVIFYTIK
jgi:MFS family permease